MKAFSLWQPWASLAIWGLKEWETRGARTGALLQAVVGQEIAIASTKSSPSELAIEENVFCKAVRILKVWSGDAPMDEVFAEGCVLGTVKILEHWPVEMVRSSLSEQELAFGDYSDGRFCTRWKVTEIFDTPVPCKGNRGLWEWNRPDNATGLTLTERRLIGCNTALIACQSETIYTKEEK